MQDDKVLNDDLSGNDSFSPFIERNRVTIVMFLIGLIVTGVGVFMYRQGYTGNNNEIEIINPEDNLQIQGTSKTQIVVEISGSVQKPGVYKLPEGARVEDLLIASGGVSLEADRDWIEKYINKAAKLIDGQKLYIPKLNEQSTTVSANNLSGIKLDQGVLGAGIDGLVNINSATLSDLDKLPGIGQVYGQNIIEHRPYSTIEELVTKGALKQSVYDKIKNLINIY